MKGIIFGECKKIENVRWLFFFIMNVVKKKRCFGVKMRLKGKWRNIGYG